MTVETFAFIVFGVGILIVITIGILMAHAIAAIGEHEGQRRR